MIFIFDTYLSQMHTNYRYTRLESISQETDSSEKPKHCDLHLTIINEQSNQPTDFGQLLTIYSD